MNYEIYIVGSIEIVGSIRISWGCDGIYENYVIVHKIPFRCRLLRCDGIYESYVIAPIVPHCSYSSHYSHNIKWAGIGTKKTRVDAFEFVRGTFLCLAVRGRPDGAARGFFSWICLCVN